MATAPPPPLATRAAQDLVGAIGRLRRRMREVATDDQLTPPQTSVLTLLGKDGPATASALAAAEGIRPQSMAATLAALDERGLDRSDPPTPTTAAGSSSR